MSETNNSNSQIYGVIVTLLLLISAAIGWYFWNKSRQIAEESAKKQLEVAMLMEEKKQLERSLDSLQLKYSELRTENETLSGKITATVAIVSQKEQEMQRIKSENATDLQSLRNQIASLQAVRSDYERIINELKAENAALRNENASLKNDLNALRSEKDALSAQVNDLAAKLAEQIRATQSANFRGTSFRVETEKRNDRLTIRAKKVREIIVSFDLVNVPNSYWGSNNLYLVITDEKGKNIHSDMVLNPVSVQTPSGKKQIEPHLTRPINLEKNQRPVLAYQLSEKLTPGNYVAAVYCDHGLLGASSFKLR